MNEVIKFSRELFLECGWEFDPKGEEQSSFNNVRQNLWMFASELQKSGETIKSELIFLLEKVAALQLIAESVNAPFEAFYRNYETRDFSSRPEDFSPEEFLFFEDILDDVSNVWLKARLADLLWVYKKPKSIEYARLAIDAYSQLSINPKNWKNAGEKHFERAIRLALQINDFDRLDALKSRLLSAFRQDYSERILMNLWIAELLGKTGVDREHLEEISSKLIAMGGKFKTEENFLSARECFEFAAKKYSEIGNQAASASCLFDVAESFEFEAMSKIDGSQTVANSFFNEAIQAYRRIPSRYRELLGVPKKLQEVQRKIALTGEGAVREMGVIELPRIDITDEVKIARKHVSGCETLEGALARFIGVSPIPNYRNRLEEAKASFQESFFSRMFSSVHYSNDGRIVGRTPSWSVAQEMAGEVPMTALDQKVSQFFQHEVTLVTRGMLIPALGQLLCEHRVSRSFMVAICELSPIVPINRAGAFGHGLWLGFEYDFGGAIHILCPQIENLVRVSLKDKEVNTTHIANNTSISTELGLGALLEKSEAEEIFGEDLVFVLRSLFTDPLGFNLRNDVAHGLLDDNSASSVASVYAWWLVLMMVIRSIAHQQSLSD